MPLLVGRPLRIAAVLLLAAPTPAAALQLHVPAGTRVSEPIVYAVDLAEGERLLIEVEGEVVGGERQESDGDREPADAAGRPAGGIPSGALVGVYAGGPPFLIGRGRLLWAAPAAGRLAFAVVGAESGTLAGGYDVRVVPLGRRGDPRQGRFPPPRVAFVPRREGGPLLELSMEDRSGLGLDRKTLRVFLDTRDGERVVLTPWFDVDSSSHANGMAPADSIGARLPALPVEVAIPAGLHRVTATVADVLGNESPPATVYLDRP